RIHCENANDGIKNFLFQYSTDGVLWSTLNINGAATNTNPDNTAWNTYHVTNPNSYRHYRLVCNDSWTSEIKAWEIEFFSSMPATAASNKPVMTKTMTDMRGETQTTDGAACTTPYGIVVGGGATSTVLVYWPHGKDNYNGPNDQSIGICRSLPKFPLENGAAGTDDRAYHSLVWHKGKLYRVGGRRGSTLLNSVDVFDFNTNSWTNIMLNNMTQFPANGSMLQRDNAAACSFGDEIFMFGGSIGASVGATPLNDAVAWNPETKTVRSLGTMAIAKNFAKTAVPCGSAIYLIGGATNHSTGGDANIWKFTP
ncbi:MAG TPA: kelch repeat-containing protein, partial [Candidatus Rifleibacterium sp.]|nr:kelch repeat-containing protein [Candidatus Rifleibacterium sp.]